MAPTTSDRKKVMEELLPPHVEPGEQILAYGEVEISKWPAGAHPIAINGENQTNPSIVLTDRRVLFAGNGNRKDQGHVILRGVINGIRWSSISSVTVNKSGQRKTLSLGIRTPRGDGMIEMHMFDGLTGMGSKDPTDDQTQKSFYANAYDIGFQHAARAGAPTASGIEPFVDREFVSIVIGKPNERTLIPPQGAPVVAYPLSAAPGGGYYPPPSLAPAVGPYRPPPLPSGPMSGVGKALLIIGLCIVLGGIGLVIKAGSAQNPKGMALGAGLSTVGIVLVAIGKKKRT